MVGIPSEFFSFLSLGRQFRAVTIVPASSFLEFPEEKKCPGPKSRCSFICRPPHFPCLDQVPRLTPTEKGSAYSQCLERVLGHLLPYLDTGLFLFGRNEIKLPLSSLRTLNSMTFGPIFPLFELDPATSGFPPQGPPRFTPIGQYEKV